MLRATLPKLLALGLVLSVAKPAPSAGEDLPLAGVLIARQDEKEATDESKTMSTSPDNIKRIQRPGGVAPVGVRASPTKPGAPLTPQVGPQSAPIGPRVLDRPGPRAVESDPNKQPDPPYRAPFSAAPPGRATPGAAPAVSPGGQPAGRKLRQDEPSAARAEAVDAAFAAESGSAAVNEKDKKCRPLPRHVKVRMNFNEAEVLEIVQWISEQTCKNFIIGDGIRGGKITILSQSPVTADEAYRAFLSALNVNNMTLVKVGEFHKLQMKREAIKDTVPTYVGRSEDIPDLDLMVTHLVQLSHIDANTITGTVKQLTTKDGDAFPYAPTNSMIISDTASNMHRILSILGQLDTPLGQEELRVIQVRYAMATELARTLEEIFGQKAKAGGAPGSPASRLRPAVGKPGTAPAQPQVEGGTPEGEESVSVSKMIADERTNQLIVMAPARAFDRLQELIDKLDVPIPGEGQIQVVPLEHADAEGLASTLTALASGTANRPTTPGGGKKPAPAPGMPQKAAELFQGEVKVTSDKPTNSLVIVASQNDFRSILKVIKQLDIPRRQVFVEAVIMEINIDSMRDVGFAFHGGAAPDIGGQTVPLMFGTQYKVQGQNFNSLVPNISLLGFLTGLQGPQLESSESILSGISIPAFGVMLQALQTDSNVNVLSTPHILTSDNEEAEIKVGENIPIPAGYGGMGGMSSLSSLAGLAGSAMGQTGASGMGGYGGYASLLGGLGMGAINRQEVGLTLKIKPQINAGNSIRMELEEELSEVKDTSNPLGPTTTKRSAKTVVVAQDQQTVVVGGLIREKLDQGETKVPILGDIPIIGWLFRSKKYQKTKTNLLLFLTPYVIESQADFRAIFERKMRERRQFLERFYNPGPDYQAFVDFRRKRGPLSEMHVQFRAELSKLENGGAGVPGELLVSPEGSVSLPPEPAPREEPAPPDAPATGAPRDEDEGRLDVE
jgi:general secretion pathway protein D